ncbi:MAG: homoserine dehydrogenase [Acutalibacteraceae bacterium]|nr:homoserine dehydrogenase [Acutalibacteraceae bacterium]
MIYTAIMGHGVVGSGVAEILINHNSLINEKIKDEIDVKYILDLRDFDDLPYSDKFIKDFEKIANDDQIKIVVEVMGGLNPAYDFVKRLLLSGKSVVTSNKELVAAKGAELLKIANENNVNFMFEASVGGGIPILRPMAQCLAANEITEIKGILNGTTNYILNKMIVDNMDFDSALSLAQEKGFAEKNPAADIEGHDACRKICILASLAFGKHVYPEQVETKGITDITLTDVEYADEFNCAVKLIGQAKKCDNGKITASVKPMLVSHNNILSNVDGVFNAIMVTGDAVGDVLFYGKGAGKMPTASAVVADVIDCAKHINARKYIDWADGSPDYVISPDQKVRLYVYIHSNDYDKLCKQFSDVFTDNTWHVKNDFKKEIAFITDEDYESVLNKKINSIDADCIKVMHTLF